MESKKNNEGFAVGGLLAIGGVMCLATGGMVTVPIGGILSLYGVLKMAKSYKELQDHSDDLALKLTIRDKKLSKEKGQKHTRTYDKEDMLAQKAAELDKATSTEVKKLQFSQDLRKMLGKKIPLKEVKELRDKQELNRLRAHKKFIAKNTDR